MAASSANRWRLMANTAVKKAKNSMISKARFHMHATAVKAFLNKPAAKKRAKKMSDTQAREDFYAKFAAKGDQHEARINFFKPKRKQTKRPEWKSAKKQVFSSSSESYAGVSGMCDHLSNDSVIESAWTCSIRTSNLKLWTAAADPDTYDCDKRDNNTGATVAGPTAYAFFSDSSSSSGSADRNSDLWAEPLPSHLLPPPSPNNSTTISPHISVTFDPPPILGHYRLQQTEFDQTINTDIT